MDKFVIRTSVSAKDRPKNQNPKSLKQAKLHNLKGVVVIEDMEKAKVLLERKDVDPQLKIDTLETLSKKYPSKEVLISTKLGKTVHRLCRDSNSEVANQAKKVYNLWRKNIVSKIGKPMIEVRCDLQTQKLREKARNLIFNSLSGISELKSEKKKDSVVDNNSKSEIEIDLVDISDTEAKSTGDSEKNLKSLAEYIEREVFSKAKRKINNQYRRTNRKIVFVLKYQKDVKMDLIKANISVPKFVETYLQE